MIGGTTLVTFGLGAITYALIDGSGSATSSGPEDRDRVIRTFWEGVSTGRGFVFENRALSAQDGTYRWHLQQAVPLNDAQGNVIKFVGTTTDIDDQKRVEESLAALDRAKTKFFSNVSHEFRTPFALMFGPLEEVSEGREEL